VVARHIYYVYDRVLDRNIEIKCLDNTCTREKKINVVYEYTTRTCPGSLMANGHGILFNAFRRDAGRGRERTNTCEH